jgi:hypothetical protein
MSKITFPGGGGAGGGAGVSDHGGLAGLADDDHSQYLLENGNRIGSGLALASGIVPTTSGEGHIGLAEAPFASGIFEGAGSTPVVVIWNGAEGNSPGLAATAGGALDVRAANGNQTTLQANNLTATATVSGANVGAATQMWISGIPVGDNLGGGGISDHGALGGLTDDDHPQYLLVDGTRAATEVTAVSGFFPNSSGVATLGTASLPFSSGIFNDGFWIRGQDDGQSPGFDRNGWNIRTIAMNGSLTNLESNSVVLNTVGSLLWGSTQGGLTSPADGEVTLKNAAGTSSGVFAANSGIFASGVVLRAPNGSGWKLTLDNDGVLSTIGPSVF